MLAAFCTERRNIEEKKKEEKVKKTGGKKKKFEGGGQFAGSDWLRGLTGMCHSARAHRLMHACVGHVLVWLDLICGFLLSCDPFLIG